LINQNVLPGPQGKAFERPRGPDKWAHGIWAYWRC